MPSSAERLQNLPPYVFAVISERIREMQSSGIDVVRMDIGNPDMPPPDAVIQALRRSAELPDNHGYSGYRGTPGFRNAVSSYYRRRFGVELDSEKQILPVIGSKEGIVNLSLAYLGKGDIAIVPDISYPSYAMGARLAGAEIYWLPLRQSSNFLPELESIPNDILERAKLLWLNYPNNPTGAIANLEFYQTVISFCEKHDILAISDNPYVDVTFDKYRAPSLMQAADADQTTAIEFMSLSKTYNMAGWRLGAAVGNPQALATLLRVKSNVDSGHFCSVYDAGICALTEIPDKWISDRNAVYQKRRDAILSALPDIGLSAEKPKASLYIWAKVEDCDSSTFVKDALELAHVSLAPGVAYGPGGQNFIRISLSIPLERIELALNRLKQWRSGK